MLYVGVRQTQRYIGYIIPICKGSIKKKCGLLQIISTILLAMKLTADCVQIHQLYKFIGHFHVSI